MACCYYWRGEFFSSELSGRMKFICAVWFAAILGIGSVFLVALRGQASSAESVPSQKELSAITVDYPVNGSIFPPEITPPTLLWRDSNGGSKRWMIEITFADRTRAIRVEAAGDLWQVGEIDPRTGSGEGLAQLTTEHATTRTWKPDEATWAKIKTRSLKPATITIMGFGDGADKPPLSRGKVTFSTSSDPVGAPVFYRDVPLMVSPKTDNGGIQPLPPSAVPLIKWKLRSIAEPQSHTVMENLYTCANCHSFSRDGRTLGIDVDGPRNDKGLYALVPVKKLMTIGNENVIRWSSFQENLNARSAEPAVKRFGFMSQVSPDGRYVVTSIGPPALGNVHQKENPEFAPGLSDRLYSTNYMNVSFNQVFFPTRGILAWYDREAKKLRPLPGANDPKFVQTSAFWSPDGKYLIFSRAPARDPYPQGAEKPDHANDPRETQIQYDLYRIPFNDGKGGKAEPVVGASGNGMSNNFPKVTPDGRWIVFVQNHNGLLMRPDSHLYIIPFAGGKARLMRCNTSLMNSWHTFSPNGHWMAFSSKSRGPYTRLMLTHIDARGNDTPAILVDNTTAANRAVNIPEFVNIPPGGMEKIEPEAARFYRVSNDALELMEKSQMPAAIDEWRKAIQLDPSDAMAHFSLAVSLTGNTQESEAVVEYRKACDLDPSHAGWFAHLAVSQSLTGDPDGAVASWKQSLLLDPSNAKTEMDLGVVLAEKGQLQDGIGHLRKAVEMAPDVAETHNSLGWELSKSGQMTEGIEQLKKAIALSPDLPAYYSNLGYALELHGDPAGAIPVLEKASDLNRGKDAENQAALAAAYSKMRRFADAVRTASRALDLAVHDNDERLQQKLRDDVRRYQLENQETRAK